MATETGTRINDGGAGLPPLRDEGETTMVVPKIVGGSLYELPTGLPIPEDDGAANHLVGLRLPDSVSLVSTASATSPVTLATLPGWTVVYCYPRTGFPGVNVPDGWNEIPGARGCTPQTCAFRDHHRELQSLGALVFGLSSQTTDYQSELSSRLHLPFGILSDHEFALTNALGLPTFDFNGTRLVKRLTLIIRDGVIHHVHYPVFPSDADAGRVIAWLQTHTRA